MRRALLSVLVGLVASPALAQDLQIEIDEQKAEQFNIDVASIETQMEAQAGEALNYVDPQGFMDSMASAAGIAAKGMGVDYASNPQKFVVGGGLGASTHSAGFSFKRGDTAMPENGFATMLSLMAGLNLGIASGKKSFLRRTVVYVNGMALDMPSDREFGGSMYNIGAHLQVKLVKGPNAKVTEWGGLDLTTGFERSSYKLTLERDLPISAPVDDVDLTWTATGTYEVGSTVDSIPVELSTNVRVLVVTAFLGAAVDIQTANSSSNAGLAGPISAAYRGQREDIGSASLTMAFDGAADPVVPRAFVGAQVNVLMMKVYGHLNAGLNGSVGGHIGARVAM
jgi:hypothetical protein